MRSSLYILTVVIREQLAERLTTHALKGGLREGERLECRHRADRGEAWLVLEQGALAEDFVLAEALEDDLVLILRLLAHGDRLAVEDDEEAVADVALVDDVLGRCAYTSSIGGFLPNQSLLNIVALGTALFQPLIFPRVVTLLLCWIILVAASIKPCCPCTEDRRKEFASTITSLLYVVVVATRAEVPPKLVSNSV